MIDGGRAVVCAVRPGFVYATEETASVHPDSPAGVFMREGRAARVPGMVSAGLGQGFGSSTAELIAAFLEKNGRKPSVEELLGWYRERFPGTSGADLAAQTSALLDGRAVYEISKGTKVAPLAGFQRTLRGLRVFRVPSSLKQKTHEDLAKLRAPVDLPVLDVLAGKLIEALQSERIRDLSVLTDFAEALSRTGRESAFSKEVRTAFLSVKGVIGVKGCGAALHDAYIVAHDGGPELIPVLRRVSERFALHDLGNLGDLLW
ncbi:MAG: hypothetical protein EBX52_05510 [Proteobacteria bacterium]|nr:hypothetical protein [Pseudomonadota bacterium]